MIASGHGRRGGRGGTPATPGKKRGTSKRRIGARDAMHNQGAFLSSGCAVAGVDEGAG